MAKYGPERTTITATLPTELLEAATARGLLDGGALQLLLMREIELHDEMIKRLDEADPLWREHEEEVAEEVRLWREERRAASVASRP